MRDELSCSLWTTLSRKQFIWRCKIDPCLSLFSFLSVTSSSQLFHIRKQWLLGLFLSALLRAQYSCLHLLSCWHCERKNYEGCQWKFWWGSTLQSPISLRGVQDQLTWGWGQHDFEFCLVQTSSAMALSLLIENYSWSAWCQVEVGSAQEKQFMEWLCLPALYFLPQ